MNEMFVHGVGVAAPGLPDWSSAQAVLRGESEYCVEPLPAFRTTRLPRNEARRMGVAVKLAFRVAEQACDAEDATTVSTVFATSAGDVSIADRNCIAITSPARAVSPTHFHNSVHNAAAGYWSIATGSRAPANSLSGGDDSFIVALCDAWATLAMDDGPVLLVCFEAVGTGMLQAAWRDTHDSFASAVLLSRQAEGALARLSRPQLTSNSATIMADPTLERLRQCNPAARSLPLLTALAALSDTGAGVQTITLPTEQGGMEVDVQC